MPTFSSWPRPASSTRPQLFAVDQFLMKGGTVVIAASPYDVSMQGNLNANKAPSGLEDWLKSHGLSLGDGMVLDPQNSPLPIPVEREVAGIPVRQYPASRLSVFPGCARGWAGEGRHASARHEAADALLGRANRHRCGKDKGA